MTATGLHAENLAFHYADGSFSLEIPRFDVSAGETVALSGHSGCGKSTFLRLLTGLLRPDAGDVRLAGQNLTALDGGTRRQFRLGSIGLVFQDFALLDYLTVSENIMLPMRLGSLGVPDAEKTAHDLATRLDVRRYWDKLTGTLSQGERQRVAIIRALAHRPAFVFADEPTASLDAARGTEVMRLLADYARANAAPLVVVTHDPSQHALFDRVIAFESLLSS
jgi:putative ABC transport system ATP-binding protein